MCYVSLLSLLMKPVRLHGLSAGRSTAWHGQRCHVHPRHTHTPPPVTPRPAAPQGRGDGAFPRGCCPAARAREAWGPGTPSLSAGAGCVPADPHPPAGPQRSLLPGSSPAPPLSPEPPSPPRARQRQGSENAIGGWRRPSHRRVPGSPPVPRPSPPAPSRRFQEPALALSLSRNQ